MCVKLNVCVSACKLKNMLKRIRRDSVSNGRKSMHHRFQNICPLYKDISRRIYINAKIKIHVRTHLIWKKFTQVNHCNWMKKICSSRYYNDNIFKSIHGHQMKSQWKDVLNICSCIYAFLMKKQYLLSFISIFFVL